MIKAISITTPNLEDSTKKEIKEYLKINSDIVQQSRVLFKVKEIKELLKFTVLTRTSKRVYLLIDSFNFKKEDDIYKGFEKNFKKLDKFLKGPFRVKAIREGEHSFNSNSLEKKIGEIVYKKGFKVDLKNPTTIIFLDVTNNKCFIGIDLSGELQKRDYKLYSHNQTINACFASALIKLANYKSSDLLIDPFCKDGTILIEAALYSLNEPNKKEFSFSKVYALPEMHFKQKKYSLFGIDSSKNNIKNAVINSKLAKTKIEFQKHDLDWLDTLFKKESVDLIITNPPFASKNRSKNELKNIYKEFFHQAGYILKPSGVIIIVCPNPNFLMQFSKEFFKVIEERKIPIGDLQYAVLTLKRAK